MHCSNPLMAGLDARLMPALGASPALEDITRHLRNRISSPYKYSFWPCPVSGRSIIPRSAQACILRPSQQIAGRKVLLGKLLSKNDFCSKLLMKTYLPQSTIVVNMKNYISVIIFPIAPQQKLYFHLYQAVVAFSRVQQGQLPLSELQSRLFSLLSVSCSAFYSLLGRFLPLHCCNSM